MNGRIDGIAFCKTANSGVVAVDVGQITAAMKKRFYIAVLAGCLFTLFHILPNTWKHFEIAVYETFGFGAVDVQSVGQTKDSDAVNDAEIGAFGFVSLVAGHLFNGFLVDFGGCCSMNVIVFSKCFHHIWVLTEVRHHTKFNLTIVC